MTNKYLEKIADTISDDARTAMGTGLNRHLTGVWGVNKRLADMGYHTSTGEVIDTSISALPPLSQRIKEHLGYTLGGAGTGAVLGGTLSTLSGVGPSRGAVIGGVVGGALGSMLNGGLKTHAHWKDDGAFHRRLEQDMRAGKYSPEGTSELREHLAQAREIYDAQNA